ncbi:MAG: tripartite tricarboxylate transporter TctB family protein [Alphaproteobacteria bacterium]
MANQSTAYRLQHTIPATCVFLVAAIVAWLSYTQEPASSYLFPRLISVAFIVLATWNLARALLGLAKVGEGFDFKSTINFLPGVFITLVFMLFAAEYIGFYVSSFFVIVVLYTLYDPAPLSSPFHWAKRLLVSFVCMAVIYFLFAMFLTVRTPYGVMFF